MNNRVMMDMLFGCLLIGLFIEVVFRVAGKFPAYTLNVFRWIYMLLLGTVVVFFVASEYGKYGAMLRHTIENERWQLIIIGLIFISAVLMNLKEKKQIE